MLIRINNIKMPLEHSFEAVLKKAEKLLKLPKSKINEMKIVRQSVDAREKNKIIFVYAVDVEIEGDLQKVPSDFLIIDEDVPKLDRGSKKLTVPPIVVGMGPAGLFTAWKLAEWGYRPIILERGKDVFARQADIVHFWETGDLNANSNVQFGEGGAGTFSDGKLTTRSKDFRINEVFKILVSCGAPEEIMYMHKPHIGTDLLRNVVVQMRKRIQEMGGRVYFNACLTDIFYSKQVLSGIKVNDSIELPAELCILAPGHSSRDTYEMLSRKGISLKAKSFAVGLRVEHYQDFINKTQHGVNAGHPALGAADYSLTYQDQVAGRGIFSFCMCPGGQVVAATSEKGCVVTNGMSEHARASGVANSAVVVSVSPDDYPNDEVLAGIEFQRMLEKKAFIMGGSNYFAPASDVQAFLDDEAELSVKDNLYPSYKPGVNKANLRDLLPPEIGNALAGAFRNFEHKIPGFCQDAILSGIESRTSAPVRIIRNESMQSPDVLGLYPIGEGAGYAGGIVSASVDGLKAAEKIIAEYALSREDFSSRDLTKIKELN